MTTSSSPLRRVAIVVMALFVASVPAIRNTDSVANAAGAAATFFISAPGVEGPGTLPGLTLETFDNITPGVKTSGTQLAIGTISANSLNVHNCTVGPTCWAGAATSTATPIPTVFNLPATTPNTNYPINDKTPFAYPVGNVIIQLNNAVNYFGFYWAAGSGSNVVKLFSGNTLVASFSTADLNALIPTSRTASGATVTANGGNVYNVDDYRGGHKSSWDDWYRSGAINCSLASSSTWSVACWNPQQFAYVHAVVPQGFTFDKVQLVANDFEFDNLAIANYTGTFDPTGLVGIPLSNASQAPSLSAAPSEYTVTFDANDNSGATATQTSSGSALLRANTFTRSGYTFAGWMTSPNGSIIDYNDRATYPFASSATLYARWVAVPIVTPTTTVPTTTSAPTTTSVPTPSSASTTTTVAQARVTSVGTKKQIPVTGNSSRELLLLALLMMVTGAVLVTRRRRCAS